MLISFDVKAINRSLLASSMRTLADSINPAVSGLLAPAVKAVVNAAVEKLITWIDNKLAPVSFQADPGDLEKYEAIEELVDNALRGSDGFMASVPLSPAESINFLAKFTGKVPAAHLDFAKNNPQVIAKLNAVTRKGKPMFTEEQQEKILANMDWMKMLLEFAPIVLKLLLLFI